MAMAKATAIAAAWTVRPEIVPTLDSTIMHRRETPRTVAVSTRKPFQNRCIKVQHGPRWSAAAAAESKYFHGTPLFSASDIQKLSRSTGNHNFDLAVDKAIQHYHKHIKMEEEDGQSIMMYPLRGASQCLGRVEMFHILLETTGGQKYVYIYVAPVDYRSVKLDDGSLKLVFFRKVDNNVALPFRKAVGDIRRPVSPRNDPLMTAAARSALAQHSKEEKFAHLIRATSQMVGEHEIFRMTFKAEFPGGSRNCDAIVSVPRSNPEKMEVVAFGVSHGWGMYGLLKSIRGLTKIVPFNHKITRYKYEDEGQDKDEYEDDYVYPYEDDKCVVDDPHVNEAARFALALHNKEDQVRRVVEATKRTYSGHEILSMKFDGELDGSRFYEAIVLVPVNDPENMRVAYFGRNGDDYCHYEPDNYLGDVDEEFDVEEDGFDECSTDDTRVIEAARIALTVYNKKDKLLRVVEGASRNDSEVETYRVRFVGEDHPLRTYVAIVSVHMKYPKLMYVEYVSPELRGPSRHLIKVG